jgi:hypothetical protein
MMMPGVCVVCVHVWCNQLARITRRCTSCLRKLKLMGMAVLDQQQRCIIAKAGGKPVLWCFTAAARGGGSIRHPIC